jgi:membrane protease YdiL (CAAX protease family)
MVVNPLYSSFRQGFISMSAPAKIIMLLLIILLFVFLSSVAAALISLPLFGISLNQISLIIGHPDENNLNVIRFFQIIQSIFLFIIPSIIAAWLYSTNTSGYLQAGTKPSIISVFLVLSSLVTAVPFMNALTALNAKMILPEYLHGVETKIRSMEENAGELTKLFLEGKHTNDLLVNMLMIAILPALGEEFMFRGIIQRLFTDWSKNKHIGIFLGAFLFSFIHFQFYGFLPRLLLGIYFGYLLIWSKSIWLPVAAHFFNNGLAVLYYHYATDPIGETTMDTIGTGHGYLVALVGSLVLTAGILALVYANERVKYVLSR